jgi:hypothetical protein
MLLEFPHPPTGCRLVFEDTGAVATAWLLGPEAEVLGDVWLYNHGAGPEALRWDAPPFQNPRALSRPLGSDFPRGEADVTAAWVVEGPLLLVELFLRGVLLARLSPGSQPGWSACALADGPLARVLEP